MNFLFRIDRTFRSDSKSLIFSNTGAAVTLWEANKLRQQQNTSLGALTGFSVCM